MSVELKILFFAKAREIVGKSSGLIKLPSKLRYEELKTKIVLEFSLEPIENSIILAVNNEYCEEGVYELKNNDEIAVIPPISGGNEKLQLEEITNLVASEKCGAITTFIGTTRDNFDGKNVVKLEYEAYESMAIKSMETICNDIRKQWVEVENIAIYHRLGTVPVKESSIIIAISSPHRADAIKAVEWCIDNVKKSVPIWKKEIYDESPGVWKENKELNPPSKKFRLIAEQEVEVSSVAPHFIQIKAPCEEIEQRIANFMERKRDEINAANVRDFCQKIVGEEDEFSCARRDSVLIKRKDSKGHLQVNKIYNNYNRDQNSQNYLSRLIPKNGIAERIVCLESQLSLTKPTPRDIYKRLQSLENHLLHLESISPEYIHFWDRVAFDVKKVKKKKIYNLEEIDEVIKQLEMQK